MSHAKKPLMAANWKMHKTRLDARQFISDLITCVQPNALDHKVDMVICPPFTSLEILSDSLLQTTPTAWSLGAQTMDYHDQGAYTGEVSAQMLTDLSVSFVIVGHSERRAYYQETDQTVNLKIKQALANRITPIICVGESLEQRESGQTDNCVQNQVQLALEGLTPDQRERVIFAYEPIWAIGTGKVCQAQEANRVNGLIRQWAQNDAIRVLYGGSMKPDNVVELMNQPHIDGGLVGGASLEVSSFVALVEAAAQKPSLARCAS